MFIDLTERERERDTDQLPPIGTYTRDGTHKLLVFQGDVPTHCATHPGQSKEFLDWIPPHLGDHIFTVWKCMVSWYTTGTQHVLVAPNWRCKQGVPEEPFFSCANLRGPVLLAAAPAPDFPACSSLGKPLLIPQARQNAWATTSRSKPETLPLWVHDLPPVESVLSSLWNPLLSRERGKRNRWRAH